MSIHNFHNCTELRVSFFTSASIIIILLLLIFICSLLQHFQGPAFFLASVYTVILPGPPFFSPVTVHFIPRPGHFAHSSSSHLIIPFSLCLWSSLVTRHSNHANPPFLSLLFSNSFSSTSVLDVTLFNFSPPPSFVPDPFTLSSVSHANAHRPTQSFLVVDSLRFLFFSISPNFKPFPRLGRRQRIRKHDTFIRILLGGLHLMLHRVPR